MFSQNECSPKNFSSKHLAAKWLVRHSIFIFELQMFGVILCEITPHFLPASRQREYAYTVLPLCEYFAVRFFFWVAPGRS